MSKKTVIGVAAGIGVIGTVAGLVHRSYKRLRLANRMMDEAKALVEKSMDVIDETIELLESHGDFDEPDDFDEFNEPDDYDDLDDDFNDPGFKDKILRFENGEGGNE